jgi:putative two-component system hydrogenase maturation factor HypX/HoxX
VATLSVKAIVLIGGDASFSNGIHLNHIEAADSPADESWLNINAIDDLIYQIITTVDKVTVAALAGSAGAGGAMMPLAADKVFAREGIIFNSHYKNMGELYGSEYWTYLLPKRVGQDMALALTEQRLPISAKKAWQIKLIDKVLDKRHDIFMAQVKHWVNTLTADNVALQKCLAEKAKIRCYDELLKALPVYRKFELTQMYANFYGTQDYHVARQRFVYKACEKCTPENLALHRQKDDSTKKQFAGSMYHFIWHDYYQMGDELVDSQHKDLFILADQLASSINREELIKNAKLIYQHVKEHFSAEEDLMEKSGFRSYKGHVREHNVMLEKLIEMDQKIINADWRQSDIQEFMDRWGKHIIHSDMAFNAYQNEKKRDSDQDQPVDKQYRLFRSYTPTSPTLS